MATAILVILDGLGVGGAPDAETYGDQGSDTLGNMAKVVGGIEIPTLRRLGLGNLSNIYSVAPYEAPEASYGRLQEVSAGKDSTTGHWELLGQITETPFPTYPQGFPQDLLAEFTRLTGWQVIGNKAASGTDIISELGDEHVASKKLIVYTSADSVFQIAAHEAICPIDELYRVCEIARTLLDGEHKVGRVIARPFAGESGDYQRTPNRKDYSVEPSEDILLPKLQAQGVEVSSIGKIYDLYCGLGIDKTHKSTNNDEGMANLARLYAKDGEKDRLLLLNLVDFDMLWGHRNDPHGMKKGLEAFDRWLAEFLPRMQAGDLLMMTADHGNDPTLGSSDHSREHVPIIAYLAGQSKGKDLGVRNGFMDVGATLADYFDQQGSVIGESFLTDLQSH